MCCWRTRTAMLLQISDNVSVNIHLSQQLQCAQYIDFVADQVFAPASQVLHPFHGHHHAS